MKDGFHPFAAPVGVSLPRHDRLPSSSQPPHLHRLGRLGQLHRLGRNSGPCVIPYQMFSWDLHCFMFGCQMLNQLWVMAVSYSVHHLVSIYGPNKNPTSKGPLWYSESSLYNPPTSKYPSSLHCFKWEFGGSGLSLVTYLVSDSGYIKYIVLLWVVFPVAIWEIFNRQSLFYLETMMTRTVSNSLTSGHTALTLVSKSNLWALWHSAKTRKILKWSQHENKFTEASG